MSKPNVLTEAQLKAYEQADVIFIAQDGFALAPSRVRCFFFAEALRARGLRAEVLSFHDHLGAGAQGSRAYAMPVADKLRLSADALDVLARNRRAVLYMQKVSYHSLAVAFAAALHGNPLVLDYDDFDLGASFLSGAERLLPGLSPLATTLALAKTADMCVASSQMLYDFLARHNDNVHLLPTATDLAQFDHRRREEVVRADDRVEILWLGDVWGELIVTDLLFAVTAFAALPPAVRARARLTINGFGAFWPLFKAVLQERFAGIDNIRLQERIPQSEIVPLLARTDIGLLPLSEHVFNHCKSPTKMFEFMAMKIAVCATAVGEPARLLRDGETGMLASDLEGFTARLEALILDGRLRRSIAENAYARVVEGLHLGAVADRLAPLLRGLLDRPSRATRAATAPSQADGVPAA